MTNELIEEYSKYIYGIAKKFNNYSNKEDLYQVGYMGLIMAYKNYDKNSNTKFTTYAYPYILGEMCKQIREDKGIKISRNITKLKYQIEKASNYLEQKYLRKPTNKEISKFLEIDENEIVEALKVVSNLESIDKTLNNDGKEINLYDVTPSKELNIDTLLSLKQEITSLNENDKKILLYSLNMTQQEIGKNLNMNQVQVSRKLNKIKQNIKNNVA